MHNMFICLLSLNVTAELQILVSVLFPDVYISPQMQSIAISLLWDKQNKKKTRYTFLQS